MRSRFHWLYEVQFFFQTQQHLTASVVNIFIFNHSFMLNCFGAVLQFGHLACWQVQGSGVLRCFTQKKKRYSSIYLYSAVYSLKHTLQKAHLGPFRLDLFAYTAGECMN